MGQPQADEISEQQIATTIVDPYGNPIPTLMIPFSEGDIDSRLLMKSTHMMEGPTTRERFSNTLVGCITNIVGMFQSFFLIV